MYSAYGVHATGKVFHCHCRLCLFWSSHGLAVTDVWQMRQVSHSSGGAENHSETLGFTLSPKIHNPIKLIMWLSSRVYAVRARYSTYYTHHDPIYLPSHHALSKSCCMSHCKVLFYWDICAVSRVETTVSRMTGAITPYPITGSRYWQVTACCDQDNK